MFNPHFHKKFLNEEKVDTEVAKQTASQIGSPMAALCHDQLLLESLFHKEVIADFEGGRITSDADDLLLREVDQRY